MPPKHQRTSEILRSTLERVQKEGGTIRLDDFMKLLGERSFALAILLFALPNSLPIPGIPGVSTIMGLPITFIAYQMLMGRESIWLPDRIAVKRFSQDGLAKIVNKTLPAVEWLEKFLVPRWEWVFSKIGDRLLGLMFIILSLIIALPIPGGNFLPGLAMSLIALGMLERDGLFVSCAVGFAFLAITIMYQVIVVFFKTIFAWLAGLF